MIQRTYFSIDQELATGTKEGPMQEQQHQKEDDFLSFLRANYWQVWESYSDLHYNYETGIDVKLDDTYYDLKVSNSKKITVFKNHKDEWYSPLTMHMDIKYLYVVEYPNCYLLYEIRKENLIMHLLQNPHITEYTGDGNDNICMDLDLDKVADDIFMLRKNLRRTI